MAVSLAWMLCLKSIVLPFILFHLLYLEVTRLKLTLLHLCLCLIATQKDAALFNSHCLFLSSFQRKTMGFGRTVSPMNVVHCCLKPSITCWNAASWIAALCALGNGLWNPTKRRRSLLTRGMLTELLLGFHPCCLFMFILWSWISNLCIFMFIFLLIGSLAMTCLLIRCCNVYLCGPGKINLFSSSRGNIK